MRPAILYTIKKLRVHKEIPKSPPSISDYALTRRQFHIFERALQKFKSDVSLWLQYLRVAQREGARALAGRIAARAVQLHPRTPALYVLAAAHELAHGGMGAARTLLLRGLRLNASSMEMWREYVRLELGFVEAVRRRWGLLGITLDSDDCEGEQGERVDRAEEQAMGDAVRREIMDGAIVRQAIDSAAKGEFENIKKPSLLCDSAMNYSSTNDRPVSESARTHCGISCHGGFEKLFTGPSTRALSRDITGQCVWGGVACDSGARTYVQRGPGGWRAGRCIEAR